MNYSPIEEVALTQKLVRIESTNPGAFEYKVSDFVYDFLAQTGADVLRHEVKDGRCNIVATLKGEQSGRVWSTSAIRTPSRSATAGTMTRWQPRSSTAGCMAAARAT